MDEKEQRTGAHGGAAGTHFLLVPGAFTGGWVWEETAARLRATGAAATALTLTGADAGAHGSAPAPPDLETHIGEVVRAIDAVTAAGGAGRFGEPAGSGGAATTPEIVLVGHGYGLHPALGAADRRPERVTRIIALDTAPAQHDQPAWTTLPDQRVREQLATWARADASDGATVPTDRATVPTDRAAGPTDGADAAGTGTGGAPGAATGTGAGAGPAPRTHGGTLPPPPSPAAWRRWGSTEGLSEAVLARLVRDAVPQPLGTLLQPLRLTGAAAAVPVTGVLCTANGTSIDLVQMRIDLGDPAFRPLTAPGVRFLELPTGHWPMLSHPDALADALRRAAAGEGHRLTPAGSQPPPHLRPFLLDVPEVPHERNETIDLYLPGGDGPHPAVIVVHGGPVPEGIRPTPRDWPTLTGYARLAASQGAIGVTFDHGLYGLDRYPHAARDVAAAVARVRADPRVDADRIALWFFSGGGLLAADWLSAPPPWLRCVAANYPILAPLPNWGLDGDRFRPAVAVRGAGELPLVVVRAGRDLPEILATVTEFRAAAEAHGAALEIIDVPEGHHGFETADHRSETAPETLRTAVRTALDTVLGHLTAP
ncbi:dienelactone hydrolase family protein [Streptomyces catenulae]|uniref:Dienelactone hydrolase family protein n=1 Tax=Streptomyces catenulae TaxID=66875 RepID=A0ABV2Z6W2_9ACTN|nr:dienelactone hydrolase family protein [Streptomyces catenulae]